MMTDKSYFLINETLNKNFKIEQKIPERDNHWMGSKERQVFSEANKSII